MFNPFLAIAIVFMSVCFITIMSVIYDSVSVAFSGLLLATVAPLITNSKIDDMALFSYLLVVVIGILWVVSIKKKWGSLVFGSLIMVAMYSMSFLIDPTKYSSETFLLFFAYVFALVFLVSSVISILRSNKEEMKPFLLVAIGNGAFIIAWILSFAQKELQSSFIGLWMVLFLIVAFLLYRVTKFKECFYIYGGVAIAMLATATSVELSGSSLTIAYIIEASLVPALSYMVTKDYSSSSKTNIIMLLPVMLSITSLVNYFSAKVVFTKDFFVLCLMVGVLLLLGFMYQEIGKNQNLKESDDLGDTYLICSSIYAYITLWVVLHILMLSYAQATIAALIIFTVIGLVKYFYGIFANNRVLMNYGRLILIMVILRLILVDVWSMEIGLRIVVFILVGVLFMSTAFISKKIKTQVVE